MNRTIPILENITKLSTNVLMTNSNNYLSIYLEKILNKKSKTLKFIPEFNCELLELLYTSLQLMNYNDTLYKLRNLTVCTVVNCVESAS